MYNMAEANRAKQAPPSYPYYFLKVRVPIPSEKELNFNVSFGEDIHTTAKVDLEVV